MSRILAGLVLGSLLATPAFAAKDACKRVKQKSNAFGVTRKLDAGDIKLTKTSDGNFTLGLGFNHGGGYGNFTAASQEVLPPGTPVDVMLEDGTSVRLSSSSNAGPTQVSIMGVLVSHYEMPITLTEDHLKALTSQPMVAFRVMKGAEAWHSQDKMNKGDVKKFMEAGQCLMTTEP